jgi:hypothetical protein
MNEDVYKNLVSLLKLFKNRPYHLAKYLADNEALSKEFIEKLSQSDRLKNLSEENTEKKNLPIHFLDISKMEDYFSSLIDLKSMKDRTIEELTLDLNSKLDELIKNEKYEDAASLRDYMVSRGIKRTNKF